MLELSTQWCPVKQRWTESNEYFKLPLFSFGLHLLHIFFNFLINSYFSLYNYLFILVINFKCLTCSTFSVGLYTPRSAVAAVGRQLAVVRRQPAVVGRQCCQPRQLYLLWLVVSAANRDSRSKGLEFNIAYNSFSVALSSS